MPMPRFSVFENTYKTGQKRPIIKVHASNLPRGKANGMADKLNKAQENVDPLENDLKTYYIHEDKTDQDRGM